MRTIGRWAAVFQCWWCAACAQPLTEVLVVVDTDLSIPQALDSLTIEVDSRAIGGESEQRSGVLAPGGSNLPVTLGLVHHSGPLGPVRVEARGLLQAVERVRQEAVFHFQRGQTRMLRLDLSSRCLDVDCGEGMTCRDGTCASSEVGDQELVALPGTIERTPPSCQEETCNGRDDDCDGLVDNGFFLDNDPDHCGGCHQQCVAPYATQAVCHEGKCQVGACQANFFDCDGLFDTGCETSGTDPANCGGCGIACILPGAVGQCVNRRCTIRSCDPGHDNCDRRPENGCEVNQQVDIFNCGGCQRLCDSSQPRTSASCTEGECGQQCDPGFVDCDGRPDTGCEDDLSHHSTCGSCAAVCVEPRYLCAGDPQTGFQCIRPPCPEGTTECGNSCPDLERSVVHCGACDWACPAPPQASPRCEGGVCGFECDPGYGNCDELAANGCETPLNTDDDCGHCGRQCLLTEGESCVAGSCFVAPCPESDPTCAGDAGPPGDGGPATDASLPPEDGGPGDGGGSTDGTPAGEGGAEGGPDARPDSSAPDGSPDGGDDAGSPASVDWVSIPGGSFQMGSASGTADERPVHPATVPSFEMLRTEVTVEQYGECVTAGSCTAPGTGIRANWNDPGYEDHPVNFVTWQQAVDFCTWAGGRLPSEAEWEYAARSGGQDTTYPWGETPATCTYAVMSEGGYGCGTGRTWPVCSKTAGNTTQGVCDMAGNTYEWVQDWHHDNYTDAPADGSAWEVPSGTYRVLRGGCFAGSAGSQRATARNRRAPASPIDYVSFRCVR